MGSGIKSDARETDTGTCFPVHLAVSVWLSEFSSLPQMDSKSIIAKFLNSFCALLYGMMKASNFLKSFLSVRKNSLGKNVQNDHYK